MTANPKSQAGSLASPTWRLVVNAHIDRPVSAGRDAARLAACFGLTGRHEVLYDNFTLELCPGQVAAVVGPSGAGKTVLLRLATTMLDGAIEPDITALAATRRPAIRCLSNGPLAQRLEVLSRCGLAEPAVLVTAANRLSGGQRYRLALAQALWQARRMTRPAVIVLDELAGCLDMSTALMLARQIRKLADKHKLAFLIATPHDWLLEPLRPDLVIVKPLNAPAQKRGDRPDAALKAWTSQWNPQDWAIRSGTIADYRELACYHYLAGPPAAHLRAWAIDTPPALRSLGSPRVAAVCLISPPVLKARGRNLAFPGRYCLADKRLCLRRLNREVECISRVVVHPVFRSAGLAVRLVRHALATAKRPVVESLAAMGAVHPLFERAGMTAISPPPSAAAVRLAAAAEATGLGQIDLAAVEPLRRWLDDQTVPADVRKFFHDELARFERRSFSRRQLARSADRLAMICRRASGGYVYYYSGTEHSQRSSKHGTPADCRQLQAESPT